MTQGPFAVLGATGAQGGAVVTALLERGAAVRGITRRTDSTAARRLARECGAAYLDTGAMYRAATLAVLRAGLGAASAPADVLAVAREARIETVTDPAAPAILLDGEDVEAEIRGTEVTSMVSAVSADPALREEIVSRQRDSIAAGVSQRGGIVVPLCRRRLLHLRLDGHDLRGELHLVAAGGHAGAAARPLDQRQLLQGGINLLPPRPYVLCHVKVFVGQGALQLAVHVQLEQEQHNLQRSSETS